MTIAVAAASAVHTRVMAAIHGACFTAAWDAKAMAELLALPGMLAMIALTEREEEPVGMILARVAADESEVLTIGTVPGWRRCGVAGRLLRAAREAAVQAGATRMFLEVAADDAAAVGLYRADGFQVVGRRRDYYGAGRDALIMARPLAG